MEHIRFGDYIGRMLHYFKGDIRFYGVITSKWGFGAIHWIRKDDE